MFEVLVFDAGVQVTDISDLRREVAERGFALGHVTDHGLRQTLEASPDFETAVVVLSSDRRPLWASEFAGPPLTTEQVAWMDEYNHD